ncbi:MAG: DoxX family protein [Planctomycetota bacterium]
MSRVTTAVSLLLALGFLASGAAKVMRLDFEVQAFDRFGLPLWVMVQVGIMEVAAAALLIRAKTTTLGAIIGVAVMSFAIPTHLAVGEGPQAAVPTLFLVGFVFVGWQRREHLATLLSRVSGSRT